MSNSVLNIPVSENTRRKLAALAVLTGKKFDSMEREISEIIEQILSAKLEDALSDMDGRRPQVARPAVAARPAPARSFADAEQNAQGSIEEEPANPVEDLAGHSLSGDRDEGAPSLEEQVENEMRAQPVRAAAPARQALPAQVQDEDLLPPEIDIPDAGGNAEAFLDTALRAAPPARQQAQVRRYEAEGDGVAPTRGFNPQRRQARVSDYTADDGNII